MLVDKGGGKLKFDVNFDLGNSGNSPQWRRLGATWIASYIGGLAAMCAIVGSPENGPGRDGETSVTGKLEQCDLFVLLRDFCSGFIPITTFLTFPAHYCSTIISVKSTWSMSKDYLHGCCASSTFELCEFILPFRDVMVGSLGRCMLTANHHTLGKPKRVASGMSVSASSASFFSVSASKSTPQVCPAPTCDF